MLIPRSLRSLSLRSPAVPKVGNLLYFKSFRTYSLVIASTLFAFAGSVFGVWAGFSAVNVNRQASNTILTKICSYLAIDGSLLAWKLHFAGRGRNFCCMWA